MGWRAKYVIQPNKMATQEVGLLTSKGINLCALYSAYVLMDNQMPSILFSADRTLSYGRAYGTVVVCWKLKAINGRISDMVRDMAKFTINH